MKQQRRYDMDWTRVLAFGLLMIYHTGMVFVGWDFHMMGKKLVELAPLMLLMNQWRLPLLFAISGAGTWYALRRRTVSRFAGERTIRLFLPLVFGMLFIVPPQIYVEQLYKGITDVSYLNFQLSVFELVPYPEGGSLSWHHLWFVLYLFFFSLISLPLFVYVRGDRGARQLAKLRAWFARKPLHLMTPALLLSAVYVAVENRWPETHGFTDDPGALLRYLLLFWLGFVVMGCDRLRELTLQHRGLFLIAAAVPFVSQRLMIYQLANHDTTLFYVAYLTCKASYCWFAILAIMGYAARYLNRNSRFLSYANEAVYPFYILHQSVMLVITYQVLPLSVGPWSQFFMILSGMFLMTALLYELLIRRFSFMRLLFGLKVKVQATPEMSPYATLARG